MVFLKRPVAPYFVLGPGARRPAADGPDRAAGAAAPAGRRASAGHRPAPESPRPQQRSNRRPRVSPRSLLSKSRRPTSCVHTWPIPTPGCGEPRWPRSPSTPRTATAPHCSPRWTTPTPSVRRTSADGIRELVEVLPGCRGRPRAPEIRATRWFAAAAVYLLAARRAGDSGQYRGALTDPDHRVRIEAVRALVSVDDVDGVVAATGDENREVRIAAAAGLATLGGGAEAVRAARRPRSAGASGRIGRVG